MIEKYRFIKVFSYRIKIDFIKYLKKGFTNNKNRSILAKVYFKNKFVNLKSSGFVKQNSAYLEIIKILL